MKLFKQVALFIFVLLSVLSGLASANEIEITAKSQVISNNNKLHTYSGDVRIAFATSRLSTTSSHAYFRDGQTIMEGDVEIRLKNAIAKTQRVTFKPTQDGLIAEMDKVTLSYR
jgi:lipopolysaccharide export system protein LptA